MSGELCTVVNTGPPTSVVIPGSDAVVSHPNEGINHANIANAVDSTVASMLACNDACLTVTNAAQLTPVACPSNPAHACSLAKPDESPSVLNALLETHGNTALEAAKYSVANLPKLQPARRTVPAGKVVRHCDRSLPVNLAHLNKRLKSSLHGYNPNTTSNPNPEVVGHEDTQPGCVESNDSGPETSTGKGSSLKDRVSEILEQHKLDRTRTWRKGKVKDKRSKVSPPNMGSHEGKIGQPNSVQTACTVDSTSNQVHECLNASEISVLGTTGNMHVEKQQKQVHFDMVDVVDVTHQVDAHTMPEHCCGVRSDKKCTQESQLSEQSDLHRYAHRACGSRAQEHAMRHHEAHADFAQATPPHTLTP